MHTIAPLVLAKLLNLRQSDWAAHLGVTPVWARSLARDPRYERRARIAVLEAALERDRCAESLEE